MDNRISTLGRFVVHHVREGVLALAGGAIVLASKIKSVGERDKTFLKVLGFTAVAIVGVIVFKRLGEHLKPLEKPVVPVVPAAPLVPVKTPGFGVNNGVWGWGNRG